MKLNSKTLEKLRNLIILETGYRSGPDLVSFFNQLGFKDTYGQGFPSRWKYTDDRLNAINNSERICECITILFSPINYIGKEDDLNRNLEDFNKYLDFDGYKVIISGKKVRIVDIEDNKNNDDVDSFLKEEFEEVSLGSIVLITDIEDSIQKRINEIKKCLSSSSHLAALILIGSCLEGLLICVAEKNKKKFNSARTSPKDKDKKVLPFKNWTLSNLIDTAFELNIINLDVKKYSHTLREFRNYIHPYEQVKSNFYPNEHTVKISWQVLKAALSEILNYQKKIYDNEDLV